MAEEQKPTPRYAPDQIRLVALEHKDPIVRAMLLQGAQAVERVRAVERRLSSWVGANDGERLSGKPPTLLNPWTVLDWMGFDRHQHPVCDECGEPATQIARDVIRHEIPWQERINLSPLGLMKYGCDKHPVESETHRTQFPR